MIQRIWSKKINKTIILVVAISILPLTSMAIKGKISKANSQDIYKIEVAEEITKTWESSYDSFKKINTAIVVKIMPDGTIKDVVIEKSSGCEVFDKIAYEAVLNSSPVKPHPDGISKPYIEVGLRFSPLNKK